jgi:hypothetical protein
VDDSGSRISVAALAAELTSLASANDLTFSELHADDAVPENALLVITTADGSQATELARSRPGAMVVAIGAQAIEAEGNLLVLGDWPLASRQAAFLAGYLGAMLTPDHRIGMISSQGTEADELLASFAAGQRYFCGLCRPAFPPFIEYPVFTTVSADFSEGEFESALEELAEQGARAIFVSPLGEANFSLPANLPEELIIISADIPPQATSGIDIVLRPAPEITLAESWNELMDGSASGYLEMPLTIDRLNPDQFSQARLRLAEEVLADLNQGFIRPE